MTNMAEKYIVLERFGHSWFSDDLYNEPFDSFADALNYAKDNASLGYEMGVFQLVATQVPPPDAED